MFVPCLVQSGMTTSFFSAAVPVVRAESEPITPARDIKSQLGRRRHTLASRLVFLFICVEVALTTLAYGPVHNWALAFFFFSGVGLVCLWIVDAFILGSVPIPVNPLQWTLIGMIALGGLQL